MPSADAFEDAVELVDAVIVDDELAAAALRMRDRYARGEFFGEIAFERGDVRVGRGGVLLRFSLRRSFGTARGFFELAHRPAALGRFERERNGAIFRQRGERARVAYLELAIVEQALDLGRKLEQAQKIRYRRARTADRVGRFLMRQLELVDQARHGLRFFE